MSIYFPYSRRVFRRNFCYFDLLKTLTFGFVFNVFEDFFFQNLENVRN